MLVNVTVKDVSPLITYSVPSGGIGDWGASSTTDACLPLYANSSFHGSQTIGATATLQFNGTGIWIYGAMRQNHGNYSVMVDDMTTTSSGFGYSGFSLNNCSSTNFQQLLYGAPDLDMATHTVQLTNVGPGWVDIDYMVFETQIGGDSANLTVTNLDDTSTSFAYTPSLSDWTTSGSHLDSFSNGTMHEAIVEQATATLEFEGDAISVYGSVNANYGPFTASMDSGYSVSLDATSYYFYPGALLYHATGLGPGTHRLTLANGNQNFDVDYATVWSTGEIGDTSFSSTQSLSGGVIAGIVIAIIASLGLLGLLFVWVRRRKQRVQKSYDVSMVDESAIPAPWSNFGSTNGSDAATMRSLSIAPPSIMYRQNTVTISPSSDTSSSLPSSISGRRTMRNRDEDAGHVFGSREDGEETPEFLPPNYDQATENSGSERSLSTSTRAHTGDRKVSR